MYRLVDIAARPAARISSSCAALGAAGPGVGAAEDFIFSLRTIASLWRGSESGSFARTAIASSIFPASKRAWAFWNGSSEGVTRPPGAPPFEEGPPAIAGRAAGLTRRNQYAPPAIATRRKGAAPRGMRTSLRLLAPGRAAFSGAL